jgi:hypothetical protein
MTRQIERFKGKHWDQRTEGAAEVTSEPEEVPAEEPHPYCAPEELYAYPGRSRSA